jgi:glucose/mannose-6-phosphate isomerase
MDLDDLDKISRIDKSKMLEILEEFPKQMEEGIRIGGKIDFGIDLKKMDKIVIAGMGGSGIIGDMIQALAKNSSPMPIFINRDYRLPRFVDERTLVIVLSYSGNTEETISSFLDALERGCRILSISSGGKLKELAGKADRYVQIKKGLQPRAALNYLLFPLIIFLKKNSLLAMDMKDIEESIAVARSLKEKIKKTAPVKENFAKEIAARINGKIPRIYGYGPFIPIARRWETQFNENSKIFSSSYAIPECGHNEIVGWSTPHKWHKEFICILFRSNDEPPQIKSRLDFMKKIFERYSNVIEIMAKGKSDLAKMIYLIYLGDYVSCYLALLRGIDPTPVDLIDQLKKELKMENQALP